MTLGAADLGPPIVASHNGAQGLEAQGGQVHVFANASNEFSANAFNGIDVSKGGVLVFEGGNAKNNGFNGIRFDQSESAVTTVQQIANLVTANENNGVAVYGGSVKIRGSKLLQNKAHGLFFGYASGAQLDLGKPGDPGNNVFGGSSANQNGKAGIFLCGELGSGTQQAEGNTWSSCPPVQQVVFDCATEPALYADVAYALAAGATAGSPIIAGGCSVGP